MANWEPTWKPAEETDLHAQVAHAQRAYQQRVEKGLRIVRAQYDRPSGRVVVDLVNGVTLVFPAALAQGIADASPESLEAVSVSPGGLSIDWENLGAGFSLENLLAGIFGNREWMERRREIARNAGRATSEAKASAARANGAKGGRPRKKQGPEFVSASDRIID